VRITRPPQNTGVAARRTISEGRISCISIRASGPDADRSSPGRTTRRHADVSRDTDIPSPPSRVAVLDGDRHGTAPRTRHSAERHVRERRLRIGPKDLSEGKIPAAEVYRYCTKVVENSIRIETNAAGRRPIACLNCVRSLALSLMTDWWELVEEWRAAEAGYAE